MKITLLTVGRIREKYMKSGIREFKQRLRHYTRLSVVQVREERAPKNAGLADLERVKEQEGKRLLEKLNSRSYSIALDAGGEALSSEGLAEKIRDLRLHGRSDITFLIGGPCGLSEEVLDRADYTLSLSNMTFTHQMIRLILLEQIYRSFKIIMNEPYHRA